MVVRNPDALDGLDPDRHEEVPNALVAKWNLQPLVKISWTADANVVTRVSTDMWMNDHLIRRSHHCGSRAWLPRRDDRPAEIDAANDQILIRADGLPAEVDAAVAAGEWQPSIENHHSTKNLKVNQS